VAVMDGLGTSQVHQLLAAASSGYGMPWEAWLMVGIVVLTLYALARNLAKPDVILMASLTLVMTLNLLSAKFPDATTIAKSFGNEGLLTVAVLFVVGEGLAVTGAIGMVTQNILGRPKTATRAQARMLLPITISAALLHPTTVVSIFVPVILDWSKRIQVNPSKLLLPLSYAAIFGGTCTLIGCSTNLVVQGLLIEASKTHPGLVQPMGMFTISKVGVPAAICGLVYLLLGVRWLLPDRSTPLAKLEDPREYSVEMMVVPNSPIDGKTIEQAGLRHLPNVYLAAIERNGEKITAVGPEQLLRGNDLLFFVGVVDSVVDLQKNRGLIPATDQIAKLHGERPRRIMVEAVVSLTCPLIGKNIREGKFRTRYNAVVIAVHRNGERIAEKIGDIVLRAGDTLWLETSPGFSEQHRHDRDFYLVSAIARSNPINHERAWISIGILFAMIVALAFEGQTFFFGTLSIFNVTLVAAGLMVLTRCLTGEQARRAIDWSILIAIGASFGIGKAMETTGLASGVAGGLVHLFHPLGSWGALLGIYCMTLLFTHFVTHNASAVIAFPIALAMATSLHANFMPFAICIAMAASNGYATPLGYSTHLMVYGPGGYRFSDFVRLGLPLDLIIMAVTVSLTPIFFPMY
jgi:di/tricarboxylate transporter